MLDFHKNQVEIIYDNQDDCGRAGRQFEVDVREFLIGKIEKMHPQGMNDIAYKRGVTIECKTGQGWITTPCWRTAGKAQSYYDTSRSPMKKAMFVCYLPKYDRENLEDALIMTQKKFLEIMEKYNLLNPKAKTRDKRHPNKPREWGICIKNYIPTEKHGSSKTRFQAILDEMFDNGEFLDCFAERITK